MSLRAAIFWLLLIVFVVVALLHVGEIKAVWRLLRSLQWLWLLLALMAQAGTYMVTVWSLRKLLVVLDYHIGWRRVWRPSIALVLGAQTVPTAGAGGLILWSLGVERLGVARASAIASGVVYFVLDYLAFFLLLAVGLIILLIERAVPHALLISLSLVSGVLLVIAITVGILLRREEHAHALLESVINIGSTVLRWIGREPLEASKAPMAVRTFYEDWRMVSTRSSRLITPGFYVLAARVLDLFTLQVLFEAVGHPIGWGALTLGYVYANFASALTLLPTGLGVLDASLAILYAGLGAPLAAAVVVTILFRVLAYWLPVPYGLYLYRSITKPAPS